MGLSPGFQPWEPSPHGDAPQRGARSSVTITYKYDVIIYVPIARPCFGAHHFLHQKSNAILQSAELRSEVHAYLTGTLRGLECDPLQVGGVQDHVHILCGLSRKISLAELIKNLKTSSTRIVKGKGHDAFSWQSGYGAFSFSQSARESVFSYIAKQEIHHRNINFQDDKQFILSTR